MTDRPAEVPEDPIGANRDYWESLAGFHGRGNDSYYDVEALVAGERIMTEHEQSALDRATEGHGVAGLRVAHLQSHIAFDSITMAQDGASVTALDFSPTALERAREIAARAGVSIETVLAEATSLSGEEYASLHGSFDLVYATIGAICWIEDIDAWMRSAAALLRPGGRLVLVDMHPLANCVGSTDPLRLDFPYAGDGPQAWSGTGSYANADAPVGGTTVEYAHSLGEVVTAAIDAGMRVDRLEEHLSVAFDPRGDLLADEGDGRYRLRIGQGRDGGPGVPLPIMFTLLATRSA
ncbi:MAG: class I SAM-dependent methyltransferase [Candidatus Nanopelagicales bacterium]